MNYSDFKITLDIQKVTSQAMIPVKKGDSARRIIVSIVENGKPYQITDECYAVFSATKPDGETLYNHCYININQIIYNITPQTTAVEGLVNANIILYGSDNEIIASPRFTILVDETVCSAEELTSTSEYSALADLVSKCQELLNADGGDEEGGEGGSVQNISGEVAIEDLPLGLSYAADNAELKFLTNVETGEEAKLSISSGACIVKTMQKLQTDAESLDAAAVYVLYGNKVEIDDEGKETVVIMEQLVPSYDNQYCGVSYSIHKTVKGESNSAGSEIDTSNFVSKDNVVTEFDPEDPEINNYIPSVKALVGYVAGLSFEGGQTLTAGEGIRIENGIISLAIENAEGGSY